MRAANLFRCAGTLVFLFLALVMIAGSSALAEIRVSAPTIDDDTQGHWQGTYGECFYLLPDPKRSLFEIPTGPGFYSDAPGNYTDPADGSQTQCFGGPLFSDGKVDFRLFRNSRTSPGAFTFGFPAANSRQHAYLDNPCNDDAFLATWDNDTFGTDPMMAEIVVDGGPELMVAFYFVNEDNGCREQDFVLVINGQPVPGTQGTIGDFADGKYVVYQISGLPAGETAIRLATDDAVGVPVCPPPADEPDSGGVNSHVSGVFVSGGDCQQDPFCGDGITDDNEECDDANNVDGDGCSANCTIEVGFCGDGVKDDGEQCDDGNDVDGDGCSADCTVEDVCDDDSSSSGSGSGGSGSGSSGGSGSGSSGGSGSGSSGGSGSGSSGGSGSGSSGGSGSGDDDCDCVCPDGGSGASGGSGSGSSSGSGESGHAYASGWWSNSGSSGGSGGGNSGGSGGSCDCTCDPVSDDSSDSSDDLCPDSDDSSSDDDVDSGSGGSQGSGVSGGSGSGHSGGSGSGGSGGHHLVEAEISAGNGFGGTQVFGRQSPVGGSTAIPTSADQLLEAMREDLKRSVDRTQKKSSLKR